MAEKATASKPKMVKIKLPLTKHEKKDEPVIVNGMSYLIKRGEFVEVPEYVANQVQTPGNKEASH
jgi:hypothetical protein